MMNLFYRIVLEAVQIFRRRRTCNAYPKWLCLSAWSVRTITEQQQGTQPQLQCHPPAWVNIRDEAV
jgi:hypothetical protein